MHEGRRNDTQYHGKNDEKIVQANNLNNLDTSEELHAYGKKCSARHHPRDKKDLGLQDMSVFISKGLHIHSYLSTVGQIGCHHNCAARGATRESAKASVCMPKESSMRHSAGHDLPMLYHIVRILPTPTSAGSLLGRAVNEERLMHVAKEQPCSNCLVSLERQLESPGFSSHLCARTALVPPALILLV